MPESWRHPRVYTEFTTTKVLIRPLFDWKSFPSDHAFLSFVFSGSLIFFDNGYVGHGEISLFIILVSIVLTIMAIVIGFSRIVVGVHYPRDILGGIALAYICLWLLEPSLTAR